MPNLDNLGIELVDRDLGMLSVPRGLRSIRFKNLSFENISRAWRNFRLTQLRKIASVVEREQNNIKDSFNPSDFYQGVTGDNNVQAVPVRARLEDKLNILNNPISSRSTSNMARAIKLKDYMNKNARSNAKNVYSTLSSKEDHFPVDASYAIDNSDENKNIRDDIIVVPDRDEVRRIVNDEFARQENEIRNVSAEEVANVVESPANVLLEQENLEDFNKIAEENAKINISRNSSSAAKIEKYSEPVIERDKEEISKHDVEEAINNSWEEKKEREKIKQAVEEAINERVTNNSFGGSKIEYFAEPANDAIKEDGTYRLTKDQIDEDFRKTYINEPIEEDKVEFAIEDDLTNKDEREGESVMNQNTINNETASKDDTPLHFDYNVDNIKDLTTDGDKVTPKSEIEILRDRVRALKQKQQESKERADKAAEQARASEDAVDKAFNELSVYEDALKKDVEYYDKRAEENIKKAQTNEKLVEDMLNMIQPQADPDSIKTR